MLGLHTGVSNRVCSPIVLRSEKVISGGKQMCPFVPGRLESVQELLGIPWLESATQDCCRLTCSTDETTKATGRAATIQRLVRSTTFCQNNTMCSYYAKVLLTPQLLLFV